MRKAPVLLLVFLAACTATTIETTTSTSPSTTTSDSGATTTRAPAVDECPPAPYEIGFLPINVNSAGFDPTGLEPDVWTSVGGTQTTFYGRNDGTVAIAVVRGTLPPIDWPGEKGIVEVDGVEAAVGPHPDGTWVMGWYVEPQARCDLYTMVFYPPWNPQEVEAVIESMVRVAG